MPSLTLTQLVTLEVLMINRNNYTTAQSKRNIILLSQKLPGAIHKYNCPIAMYCESTKDYVITTLEFDDLETVKFIARRNGYLIK